MPRKQGQHWICVPANKHKNGQHEPKKFEFSAELARLTKLRTLADMSETEIRALEKFYGCPVRRPQREAKPRRKRDTVTVAPVVAVEAASP